MYPYSIKHTYRGKWNATGGQYARLSTCKQPPGGQFNQHDPLIIDAQEGQEVVWTYDVEWVRSNVKWASRWDVYLQVRPRDCECLLVCHGEHGIPDLTHYWARVSAAGGPFGYSALRPD